MPKTKSAIRGIKTSAKRHAGNRSVKNMIITARKKLYDAIAAGDKTKCKQNFSRYCSILDKAVKNGTLKANTASRRKSRAARKLAAAA